MSLYIPVILGTARKERSTDNVTFFVESLLSKEDGIETEIVDVKNFELERTIPPWEESDKFKEWKEKADRADGYIIVVPEYNHGYPGDLKMFLDSAYKEYEKKPVLVCGVSSGGFGGSRVVENLRPVLIEYGMVPLRSAGYFSNVGELFNDEDEMADDEKEKHEKKMKRAFEELLWFARVLNKARN